jgi:hypothetical protein
MTVPADRHSGLAQRVARWPAEAPRAVDRGEGRKPIDLVDFVQGVEFVDGVLRMRIRVTHQGTARPREVLKALGLDDVEQNGSCLTRTKVELQS